MKILMVMNSPFDLTRGAPRIVINLGRAMRDLDAEVDFLFREEINPKLMKVNTNLSVLTDSPFYILKRIQSLKKNKYDIVDISWSEGYLWGVMRKILRQKRPIYAYRAHGIANRAWDLYNNEKCALRDLVSWKGKIWYPNIFLRQEKISFKISDAIFVNSTDEQNYLIEKMHIAPSKIITIPAGITEDLSSAQTVNKDMDIIFIGRWKDIKGVKYLSEAMEELWESFPNITLTIVGAEKNQVFSSFSEPSHKKIVVYGQTQHENLVNLLLRHKILVAPSIFEGFGTVSLEGMAAGCAVVATMVGGAKDLIDNERNGFLIPSKSSTAIVQAVKRLIGDETLRIEIGRQARQKGQSFTYKRAAEKTIAAYQQLLDSGNK